MAKNDHFMRVTIAAGINYPRCGLASRDLVQRLAAGPLPVLSDSDRTQAGRLPLWRRQLGPVISAGLARHDKASRSYLITPAGRAWLAALEVAGLTAAPAVPAPTATA
jgi:hypothetical protein